MRTTRQKHVSSVTVLGVACCAFLLVVGGARPASAVVLNFDDIPGCTNYFPSTSYGGFTWSAQWAIECDSDYQGDPHNNTYGAPSADQAAGNGAGEFSVAVTRPGNGVFSFLGADVTTWTRSVPAVPEGEPQPDGTPCTDCEWIDEVLFTSYSSHFLDIYGYLGNTVMGWLHTDLFNTDGFGDYTTPFGNYISLNMLDVVGTLSGIDRLEFNSEGTNTFWLMDNANLETPDVPEPGSLLLLGTGLCAAASKLRSRRRKPAVAEVTQA